MNSWLQQVLVRPIGEQRVEAEVEIERTRAHVVATRRFLDEMRTRMRGRKSRSPRKRLGT